MENVNDLGINVSIVSINGENMLFGRKGLR